MIRVIKIGGRAQNNPDLPGLLAAATDEAGRALCIVHGGGDEVSTLQRRLGLEPRFVGGRRFTSPEDVELVRMVLSGTVNKRLVRQFEAAGVPAVGVSGEDGSLLTASVFENGALGAVGVAPVASRRPLDALMRAGFVPVVSPLGRDAASGEGLNINGDDAAAAIAIALGADELLLVADVAGVLDADRRPLATLDCDTIPALIGGGVARDGMAAKLEAGRRAVLGGVRLVRIGDVASLTDPVRGTSITLSPSVV